MSCEGPRLSYLLRQTQLAIRQKLDKVLQDFGLTPAQYTALSIICAHPEGMFSAALARRLDVTPQSSNEIVASLEQLELIRRDEFAGHRRVLHLRLTAKGRALLARCEKSVDRFEADFFAALSPDEQAQCREMLMRIIRDTRESLTTEPASSDKRSRPQAEAG